MTSLVQSSKFKVQSSKLRLTELTDFAIPYGIKILKGKPKEIVISAQENLAGFENLRGLLTNLRSMSEYILFSLIKMGL